MQETGGSGHMLKRQLMAAAQPLSEQSFTIVSLICNCLRVVYYYGTSLLVSLCSLCLSVIILVHCVKKVGLWFQLDFGMEVTFSDCYVVL